MRRVYIYLAPLFAGMLAVLVSGCGSGVASLTGGSIPIGDIDGQIWRSPSRSLSPVRDVSVELLTPNEARVRTVRTDAEGRFSFQNVRQGQWLIRARHAGEEARIAVEVQPGSPVRVALRLAVSPPMLEQIWLTPEGETVTLAVGETAQFQAWERQGNGQQQAPLPVSWAVQGTVGSISPEGEFTAEREGAGVIIAQYGRFRAQAAVCVLPIIEPPEPPVESPYLF